MTEAELDKILNSYFDGDEDYNAIEGAKTAILALIKQEVAKALKEQK